MGRLSYAAVLVFVVIGSGWLELALRTRVVRRWRRLLLTLLLPLAVFVLWDAYAIASGHWHLDETRILGWRVVAGVPVDEVLFFLVIPVAAVLTFEGVRAVRDDGNGDDIDAGPSCDNAPARSAHDDEAASR